MSARTLPTQALSYELEIPIAADPATVWRALTEEVGDWWLPDFHMVAPDSAVTLEARAGGQLLEARPDGASLLWYTVTLCTPGESLHLVGHLAPPWGGPATSMLSLALTEGEGGSVLRLTDSLVGHVDEAAADQQREGWQQLFGDGLKAHVEAATTTA